jgi:hypothetical protein
MKSVYALLLFSGMLLNDLDTGKACWCIGDQYQNLNIIKKALPDMHLTNAGINPWAVHSRACF